MYCTSVRSVEVSDIMNRMKLRSKAAAVLLALYATSAAAAAAPCKEPALGAALTNVSDSLRATRKIPDYVTGALVRSVERVGPAARAAIHPGDVVQAVGGDLVQNVCDFLHAIEKHGCEEVHVVIRRQSSTIGIDVTPVPASRLRSKKVSDQQACGDGDGAACVALAHAHNNAPDLLRLACDLGDTDGCFEFALSLGERDDKAAVAAYQQACDGAQPLACTNLGFMYQNGRGVAADLDAARRLYERGCRGSSCRAPNNLGCINLGRFYRDGTGVAVDQRHALSLFRDVCDRSPLNDEDAQNIARACSLAGTVLYLGKGLSRDMPAALALLEKGCDAADPFGCFNLGSIYQRGDGVTTDKARAEKYYQRACEQHDTEACEAAETLRKVLQ